MAGLYSKRIILFKNELWGAILRTQILNIVLAALYFFLLPGLGIAPKTILVFYLIISLVGIFIWRLLLFPQFTRPTSRDKAAIIGEGAEVLELLKEVNGNVRYQLEFILTISPEELVNDFDATVQKLRDSRSTTLVVDTEHAALQKLLPQIYELAFVAPTFQFVDFYAMYEDVFDRVPLSLLQYDWFLKHVPATVSNFYEVGKRSIDIIGGMAMFLIMLAAIPLVFIALRIEGSGPLFIKQNRFGKNGSIIKTFKFRSMRYSDAGIWKGESQGGREANYVTRVGSVLRTTSLDEFPQCINILRGELSLIGPRNDIVALGERLSAAVPYYTIRYMVKPGITGWAQINQQYEQGNISPQSIEETKTRLAYDFYYIKNRSFVLDIVIALKTVKRMLFRVSTL
jgi:lipopolysaccharide/colanic/teichoic acid biosynthesis glycosyltransferase